MGWFEGLGQIGPTGMAVGGLSYLTIQGLANSPVIGPVLKDKLGNLPGFKPNRVNETVKMDCAKVVDTIDMEDLGDKAVLCRCWKSKKFPYCDGSHNKHNIDTGDNGPSHHQEVGVERTAVNRCIAINNVNIGLSIAINNVNTGLKVD